MSEDFVNVSLRCQRSDIWYHFTQNPGTHFATCHHCKHSMSYKTTITNLRRHLAKKHPEQAEGLNKNHQQVWNWIGSKITFPKKLITCKLC